MGLLHIAQKKLWVYGLFFNVQGFLNLVGLCFNFSFLSSSWYFSLLDHWGD